MYSNILSIFEDPDGISKYNLTEKGATGDYLNGFLAPIIGLAAVITTFLAFVVQYQANRSIREDTAIERFENKFYEMLRLHKENVNEIEIAGKYKGRKAFLRMFEEFRFIYHVNEQILEKQKYPGISIDGLTGLSYSMFFHGVPINPLVNDEYHPHPKNTTSLYSASNISLRKAREKSFKKKEKFVTEDKTVTAIKGLKEKQSFLIDYYPFDGHSNNLGHYYRHLYQLVKFVVTERNVLRTKNDRYKYIKMIRAQLSNYEQALLYYNSFFNAGIVWWEDEIQFKKNGKIHKEKVNYFFDYKVIKNIPFDVAKIGKLPAQKFKEIIKERNPNYEPSEINKELGKYLEWSKIIDQKF